MKKHSHKFICLLFVVFLKQTTYAQLNFGIQKIDMPKPFTNAFIKNVSRDGSGFIYFTTNQGIWRYDGTDVQPFNIPGITLPSSPLVSRLFCYEQFIFLGFKNDPDLLYCYNSEIRKLYKYRVKSVSKFAVNPKLHRLMLFTKDGQAFSFEKETGFKKSFKLDIKNAPDTYPEPDVYFFAPDGKLFLLFRTNIATVANGITKFGKDTGNLPGAKQNSALHYDLNTTFITDAFTTSKYVVVRYARGFAVYDKNTLEKKVEYYNDDEFSYTFPVKDTIVAVFRGHTKSFKLPQSPYFRSCQNIEHYSDLKRIWPLNSIDGGYIATTNNHLLLISGSNNTIKDTSFRNKAMRFFNNKSIRGIYKDGNRYFVGTYSGFYIFDDHGPTAFPIISYTMARSGSNQLLIGVEGGDGFATFDINKQLVRFLPNPGHGNLGVTKLLKYKTGFIAGMRSSLYIVSKDARGQWLHRLWLTDERIGIIKDIAYINNHFWVAGEGGLFRLDGNKFTKVEIAGLTEIPVYALLKVDGGVLLATLGQGIVKIDNAGKFLWKTTFTDGLAGDFAYSLLEVDGLLFAGTNGGLSVLDLNSMQFLPNPDDSRYEDLYTQEFNHSAMYYDDQNRRVIMGGLQGLVFLDIDYYKSLRGNSAEKVTLSYVKKSSNTTSDPQIDLFTNSEQTIRLQPDENLVALKFAGSFKQKDILYRIKEMSATWRKSKLFNEISFYALSPGVYTLQARFPANTDPKYWLAKTLVVEPSFYETWLFKIIVSIVIILIICQLWLSRIQKLKREMELRTNIASDLHDEIGSTLTRISLSSELMYTRQTLDEEIIQKISTESKNAIASISDIIWSVDARNDNREDLIFRMQEHVHFMLSDTADFIFETVGLERVGTLPQLLRQNIYLIFKEAINNIVRHNRHPRVWILLNNGPNGMKMTIKNTLDQKPTGAYSGHGLKNMKMRAERIRAVLSIVNTDEYFTVTIKTRRW